MNNFLNIPYELVEYIKEIAYDSPKNNYNKVIKQLKKNYCHPLCGDNCLYKVQFKKGSFIRNKIFISQCYKRCKICDSKVSKIEHDACHDCAYLDKNCFEFNYHHKNCIW